MNILAFETSTALGSIALIRNSLFFSEKTSKNSRKHTEFLTTSTDELLHEAGLDLAQIDLFAVGIGPGSFTGIRVAVNAARAYAQVFNKPVFVADSLKLISLQTVEKSVCMLNAYKNLVYFSLFQNDDCLVGPTSLGVNQIDTILEKNQIESPVLFIGDGFLAYQKSIEENLSGFYKRDLSFSDYPSAKVLAQYALKNPTQTKDWKSVIPLYIRASEAEENLQENLRKK